MPRPCGEGELELMPPGLLGNFSEIIPVRHRCSPWRPRTVSTQVSVTSSSHFEAVYTSGISKACVWPVCYSSRNGDSDTACDFSVSRLLPLCHSSLLPSISANSLLGFAPHPPLLSSLQSSASGSTSVRISVLGSLRRFSGACEWHWWSYSGSWVWPPALRSFRRCETQGIPWRSGG